MGDTVDHYIELTEGICIICGKVWWGWESDDGYMDGEFICSECTKEIPRGCKEDNHIGDTVSEEQYQIMLQSEHHKRANQLAVQIDECIENFEKEFPGWTLNFDVQDGMGLYYPSKVEK